MLPDWPEAKASARDFYNYYLAAAQRAHLGPLADIGEYRVFEGGPTTIKRADGRTEKSRDFSAEASMSLTREEARHLTLPAVLHRLNEMAATLAEERGRTFYSEIGRVTEEAGNVVTGAQLSLDLILELLDRMDIEFDDEGKAIMPQLHLHPDMLPRVQQLMTEAEADKEHKSKLDRILAKKREAWNAREIRRELVG